MVVRLLATDVRPAEDVVAELINAILNAPFVVKAHVYREYKGSLMRRIEQSRSVNSKIKTFVAIDTDATR